MQKEIKEALRIRFKLAVLEYAWGIGNVTRACREFEVPRSTFYDWKKVFDKEGKAGLVRKKPVARNHPRKLAQDVVDQILHLRQKYKLGPERITWYLERYHGVKTSVPFARITLVSSHVSLAYRRSGYKACLY